MVSTFPLSAKTVKGIIKRSRKGARTLRGIKCLRQETTHSPRRHKGHEETAIIAKFLCAFVVKTLTRKAADEGAALAVQCPDYAQGWAVVLIEFRNGGHRVDQLG